MPDKFKQIQKGFNDSTMKKPWDEFTNWLHGLLPEKKEGGQPVTDNEGRSGSLPERIAQDVKILRNPRDNFPTSGDLNDWSDEDLIDLYSQLRDYTGQNRAQMIEELTTYRNRMLANQ